VDEQQQIDIHYYFNSGLHYSKQGNHQKAIENYKKALEINPNFPQIYYNLANVYNELKHFDFAIENYRKAYQLDPSMYLAVNNMGVTFAMKEDYASAIECFKRAAEIKPDIFDPLNSLGITYHKQRQYDLAIETYKRALLLQPSSAELHKNIGISYIELDCNKAIEYLKKAVELNPNSKEAYNNLGIAFFNNRDFEQAIQNYHKALSFDSNYSEALYNLSAVHLIKGEYEKGFDLYEYRLVKTEPTKIKVPTLTKPKWQGEDIKDKTVYVYKEQGFGDTIMFCRYVHFLKQIAKKVIFRPQSHLKELFKANFADVEFPDDSIPDENIACDVHIPLLSLAKRFQANITTIPVTQGYLRADNDRVAFYNKNYFKNNKYKIGIYWYGDSKSLLKKSTNLSYFYKLAGLPDVQLYSLQKGYGIEELQSVPNSIKITDLGSTFKDFADTAAAIANLDLVITVDTAVAHLAGAMGKPVWLLLHTQSEWRWMTNREYTPWYSSIKLFRQNEKDNWEELFNRVYCELSIKIGNLYAERKKFEKALECYNIPLKFNYNVLEVYNNMGVCYHNLAKYEQAIDSYKELLKYKPDSVETYCNLGAAYSYSERHQESEDCYIKAAELNPNYPEAYYNRALLYARQNMTDKAIEYYEKSIQLDPHPNKIFNLATSYLLKGDYEKGLYLYENRVKMEKYKPLRIPEFDKPKWDGTPLNGKTIYVYTEQGFGDSIQFSRYIFQLNEMGGKIKFKPQWEVERLFMQSNFPVEMIDRFTGHHKVEFDVHSPVMSLPYLLKAKPDNIPISGKYLYASPNEIAVHKKRFFDNDCFKIGIKWNGTTIKTVMLEHFYRLAELNNVKFYSLQTDINTENIKNKPENFEIIDIGSSFHDFADTAAAIENLDLVISVDTSVAHLAGALGKPVWILIPFCPEWRWFMDREDTPWYGSARLFRQKHKNNWEEVFDRIYEELAQSIFNNTSVLLN